VCGKFYTQKKQNAAACPKQLSRIKCYEISAKKQNAAAYTKQHCFEETDGESVR